MVIYCYVSNVHIYTIAIRVEYQWYIRKNSNVIILQRPLCYCDVVIVPISKNTTHSFQHYLLTPGQASDLLQGGSQYTFILLSCNVIYSVALYCVYNMYICSYLKDL